MFVYLLYTYVHLKVQRERGARARSDQLFGRLAADGGTNGAARKKDVLRGGGGGLRARCETFLCYCERVVVVYLHRRHGLATCQ